MAKSKKNKVSKKVKNPSKREIEKFLSHDTYEKKPSNKELPYKIKETFDK